MTLKVTSQKHHEFQWHLCSVTFKSHLWAEYPALRSVKPASATSAPEHKVFLYLQTWSQSLWKACSLLLVEVDPGFYGNCWILRTWNAICGSGTERQLRHLDKGVCSQEHPFPASASPHSHHKPYFLERKNRQVFIDFARHDRHCQPANYMKLIWVTIRRHSCQILSTLDDSAIYSGIYVQEKEDRQENLCCVMMTNISYLIIRQKDSVIENLSTCLSFWLVLETCLAKVIYKTCLRTVRQLTLMTEHLVLLLSS